jgi:hypothetical protein
MNIKVPVTTYSVEPIVTIAENERETVGAEKGSLAPYLCEHLTKARVLLLAERHDAARDTGFILKVLALAKAQCKRKIVVLFEHFRGAPVKDSDLAVAVNQSEFQLKLTNPPPPAREYQVAELLKAGVPYAPALFTLMHDDHEWDAYKNTQRNLISNEVIGAPLLNLLHNSISPAFFKTIALLEWAQKEKAPVFGIDLNHSLKKGDDQRKAQWDAARDYFMAAAIDHAVDSSQADTLVVCIIGMEHADGLLTGVRRNVISQKGQVSVSVSGNAFQGMKHKDKVLVLQYAGKGEGSQSERGLITFATAYPGKRINGDKGVAPSDPAPTKELPWPGGAWSGEVTVFKQKSASDKTYPLRLYYQPK